MEPWLSWLIFIALALEGVGVCFLMIKVFELEDAITEAKHIFLHELREHEKGIHGMED